MIDRQTLAQKAEPLGKQVVETIQSSKTSIKQYETPFFAHGGVYLVVNSAEHHPVIFAIGCPDPGTCVMLPSNPDGFVDLASKAGLDLGSTEKRLAYLEMFLQTTAQFRGRFRVIHGFSEIELINNPSADQRQHYEKLRDKYEPVIRAGNPAGEPPWQASLYALIGQDLVRLDATLKPDGQVQVSRTVLERELPTVRAN